ncbi:gliding motility-associated lipoprotein GldH [Mesonia maritima]|uniref:Gliding motility-associated lipoprotein GldH n=2 Tax=Mesonia maritima TaxID=1793873 RepID=A0ABU1K265_9FLAO|nr:gliding motility-associated lipoprotein GldH [Mesonia maritima]
MTSCDSKQVFDEYKSVGKSWHKDSIVNFQVKDLDTLKSYNLFINIRNNSDFNYNNLFLITSMNFPNGKIITDTLEYEMAYPDGKFMGSGFGEVKENKLWYKEKVQFTEEGVYQVDIQQAMRKNGKIDPIEKLEGITEVGFRIEKVN